MKYKATTGLTNDKTGKRFEVDATVTDSDFPKSVIAEWVKQSILVPENPEPKIVTTPKALE